MSEFQRKKIRPWDNLDSFLPISNQLVTNKEPNGNQKEVFLVTNKEPISNQLVTKTTGQNFDKVTNKEPISNPISNRNKEPISNQLVTAISNQLVTNEEAKIAIKRLTGIQKKILFFIVDQCVAEGHLTTNPITNETLRDVTKSSANTIKTAIQRLVSDKKLLQRTEGKRGKGGFSCFAINKEIRNAVIEERKTSISNQLVTQLVTDNSNQLVTNKVPNRVSMASSSSSINLNKETTTTSEEMNVNQIHPDWLKVSIEPLVPFGFTQTHLLQIARQAKLYPEMVQKSILGFAFDLTRNDKAQSLKTNPVNYFMGILRNGQPYVPPSNYESPEDEAMRLYLERRRMIEQGRAVQEREVFELAFQEWLTALSEEEKNKILPMFVKNLKAEQPKIAEFKNYFSNEIWANKRIEILGTS